MSRVEWSELRYSLASGRVLLDGASGSAGSGRVLAVLGPSGAGKTTLLKLLARQLGSEAGACLSGSLNYFKSQASSPADPQEVPPVAFVAQDSTFFSNLTVWETVLLAARLRSSARDEAMVAEQALGVLTRLGLENCLHTKVGGDTGGKYVTGISGGERRRLAIACEIVGADDTSGPTNARILIADEPTSGLDSFQSDLVVAKLKELAKGTGSIVVCSLHQPRSATMNRVDDLLLLGPGGRVVYMGPVQSCLEYFAGLGHPCPSHYSVGEFVLDLVSIDTSSEASREGCERRMASLAERWKKHSTAPAATESSHSGHSQALHGGKGMGSGTGFWRQFRLLLGRVARQTRRDMWNHAARLAASVILGTAYGATNFRLGRSQKSIKSRASLMFQLCITTSMMSIVKTLNSFPMERVTVRREMARGQGQGGYGAGAYFLSKLLVESPVDAIFPVVFGLVVAPMAGLNTPRLPRFLAIVAAQSMAASGIGMTIGAICPTVDTALALGPALMVVSIMVADESGMFAEIPDFMKPLAKLSVVRWGFQGCMAAEMYGLTFEADDSMLPKQMMRDTAKSPAAKAALEAQKKAAREMCLTTGEDVLANLGFGPGAVASAMRAVGAIYAINAAMTFVFMRSQCRHNNSPALSGNMMSC